MKELLFIVVLVNIRPCYLAFPSTLPTHQLLTNTLQRWSIAPDDPFISERTNRFYDFYASIGRTTSDVDLQFINRFSVLTDAEYEAEFGAFLRSNLTLADVVSGEGEGEQARPPSRRRRALASSNEYWFELGLITPRNQLGCGSCWSFPVIGAIEALHLKMTGEKIGLSEQFLVDCSSDSNGCAGGNPKEGFRFIEQLQYIPTAEEWPYTGYYQACEFWDDINGAQTRNGLKKIWVTQHTRLAQSEDSFLEGLDISPVSVQVDVSNDIFAYSGGLFDDEKCETDPNPHAMLIVGYTETWLRVKASYGADHGEGGYMRYKRGVGSLTACGWFNWGMVIQADYRRELEYAWANNKKLSTVHENRNHCKDMDTASETGWDLATIPTEIHNNEVVNLALASYPDKKSDDKFNLIYFGARESSEDSVYEWLDGITQYQYSNDSSGEGKKYGMLEKNDGDWSFKSSDSYKARAICSRPVTCWNIDTAVANADVTFSNSNLQEGSVATIACKEYYVIAGSGTLTCSGGSWGDLPTCTLGSDAKCSTITVDNAVITPSQPAANGATITVTCNSDYQITGTTDTVKELTCSGTSFTAPTPTCTSTASTECSTITVDNAVITPSQPAANGATITVTCNSDYQITGTTDTVKELTCSGTSFTAATPTCTSTASTECSTITVDNAVITPSQPAANGATITVTCNSDYQITGTTDTVKELTCSGTSFTAATPTCELKNEVSDGCTGGSYYTTDGCVQCAAGSWLPAGDSATDTIGVCNECPDGLTSDVGSDDAGDCRYASCECMKTGSTTTSSDGKVQMSCTCYYVIASSP